MDNITQKFNEVLQRSGLTKDDVLDYLNEEKSKEIYNQLDIEAKVERVAARIYSKEKDFINSDEYKQLSFEEQTNHRRLANGMGDLVEEIVSQYDLGDCIDKKFELNLQALALLDKTGFEDLTDEIMKAMERRYPNLQMSPSDIIELEGETTYNGVNLYDINIDATSLRGEAERVNMSYNYIYDLNRVDYEDYLSMEDICDMANRVCDKYGFNISPINESEASDLKEFLNVLNKNLEKAEEQHYMCYRNIREYSSLMDREAHTGVVYNDRYEQLIKAQSPYLKEDFKISKFFEEIGEVIEKADNYFRLDNNYVKVSEDELSDVIKDRINLDNLESLETDKEKEAYEFKQIEF